MVMRGGSIANSGQQPNTNRIIFRHFTFWRKPESVKRTELHQFKVMPKRWVVERTIGGMNNFRGLSKDYDYDLRTGEAKLMLGSIDYLSRRLTKPPAICTHEISDANETKLAHINKDPPQIT